MYRCSHDSKHVYSFIYSNLLNNVKPKRPLFEDINFNKNKNKILKDKNIAVVELKGSYYEMGQQFGRIFKEEILKEIEYVWPLLNLNKSMWKTKFLSPEESLRSLLERYWNNSQKPKCMLDFIKGVGQITGKTQDLELINMYTEMATGLCTIYGNKDLFIRTTDNLHFDSPQYFILFKPNLGFDYACFTTASMYSCLTGINNQGICLGTKGISSRNKYGMPYGLWFHKMLRTCQNISEYERFLKKMEGTAHQYVGFYDLNLQQIGIYETLENNVMITPYNYVTMNPDKEDTRITDYIFVSKNKLIKENPIKFLRKRKNGMFHVMIVQGDYIYLSTQSTLERAFVNTFIRFKTSELFSK